MPDHAEVARLYDFPKLSAGGNPTDVRIGLQEFTPGFLG